MKLILGSSSKFRQRILRENGYTFEVMKPDIDEKSITTTTTTLSERGDSDPAELVISICKAKAQALLPKIKERALLITCDQVIHYNGQIREKPESKIVHVKIDNLTMFKECREYLKSYEEGPAVTVSGVMITDTGSGECVFKVDIAKQYFKPVPEYVVDQLIEKGDIMHCAGGFLIDDPLMFPYLDKREGTEDSIIGLPMHVVKELINKLSK